MGSLSGATVELLAAVLLVGYFAFFVGTVVILARGAGIESTMVWACTLLYCLLMVGTQPWALPIFGTSGFSGPLSWGFLGITSVILLFALIGLILAWLRARRGKGPAAPSPRSMRLVLLGGLLGVLALGCFYARVASLPQIVITEEIVAAPANPDSRGRTDGRFRVAAKVRNVSSSRVMMPAFRILGDGVAAGSGRTVTALCLEPGEAAYVALNGEVREATAPPHRAELHYGGRDHYVPEDYAQRQSELKRQLEFVDSVWRWEQGGVALFPRLANSTGVAIDLVEATAAFLDSEGHLIDAAGFLYDPSGAYEQGIRLAPLRPEVAQAKKIVVQIDRVRPLREVQPGSVPPVPSVR